VADKKLNFGWRQFIQTMNHNIWVSEYNRVQNLPVSSPTSEKTLQLFLILAYVNDENYLTITEIKILNPRKKELKERKETCDNEETTFSQIERIDKWGECRNGWEQLPYWRHKN
jgi:hypothetical protein